MAANTISSTNTISFEFSPYKKLIRKLFVSDTSDVEFRLMDEDDKAKTIRAHKQYLSAISSVFESMFNGNWKEANNVKIEDVKFDMFNVFMQCLYGEKIEIDDNNVLTLLYLSKKYDIDDIVSSCSVFLIQRLAVENVLSYLNAAITYDVDALQDACETLISESTEAIFELPAFLSCSQNLLTAILKLEKVSCSEVAIFANCMKWAKQRCRAKELNENGENLRNELGDCFSLLRFKEMSIDDFVKLCKIYNDGLFSNKQLCDMMVYFHEGNLVANKRYLAASTPKPNEEIIYRFPERVNKEIKKSAKCSIRFSTSKPLLLTKVCFSNILLQTTDKLIACQSMLTVQIVKNGALILTSTAQIELKSFALCNTFRKKCLISEGTYELRLSLEPKIKIGSNFVTEYDIKGQTKDNVDLIIHENGIGQNNQLNLINSIHFEKFDESNLDVLDEIILH